MFWKEAKLLNVKQKVIIATYIGQYRKHSKYANLYL